MQAAGALDINVDRLGVDLLSIGAHKFYGPKGVGALYVRQRTPSAAAAARRLAGEEPPRRHGERRRRRRHGEGDGAGVRGVRLPQRALRELRDKLFYGIPERVPHVHITGPHDLARRVSNNFSACFEYIEGEAILIALDLAGVAASSGSACTSGSLEPSHVLTALGVPEDLARGSLRLTVGHENTLEQMDYVLEMLPGIVSRLRSLSPTWRERVSQRMGNG